MNKPTENWKGKWILNLKLSKTGLNWFGHCEGCVQCNAVYIFWTPEMREGTSPLHLFTPSPVDPSPLSPRWSASLTSSHPTPRWRNSKPCELELHIPLRVATACRQPCACACTGERCLCGASGRSRASPPEPWPTCGFPRSYMVMPFVAQDLGHIMKRRQLTDRIIVYLFYQLLRGLKVTSIPNILHFLYTV